MAERRLTVSRLFRESKEVHYGRLPLRPVPFLRMRGDWLERAGFGVGEQVRVQVARGRLVIEPVRS